MKLSPEAIGRFRKAWERTYPNTQLTDAEAQEYASRLLTLVSAVVEGPRRGRGPPFPE